LFETHIDASGFTIGGVLMEDKHPPLKAKNW
jgi:hypothetical protein